MFRQTFAFAVVTLALVAPANTVQDQAYFAILAETKVGRMAGMPVMDLGDLPPGFSLPPEAMMFAGIPARILNIRLWSPSIAPPNATASVAPPAGLKQGPKLDLELYRPKADQTTGEPTKDFNPGQTPDFTIKIYWGSSTTVKEGQPKIFKWDGISAEQQAAMMEQAKTAQQASSYFYKPNWTTGYWPTTKQPGKIAKDASLVGKYSLTTNYTGNVEIEAPSNVNFLNGYEITSPDLEEKIDLKKAMTFKWKAIPNALGQYASIIAMEGKNTLIIWSSSEIYEDGLMGNMDFMQMADVRANVTKTIFMPPTQTTVSVPNGIFAKADFVMMNMGAWGPGAALETAQPLPRIQTKSSLMLMLGGK
ncbi:hypothetical protein QM565_16865 [Geitlerinema splendidum]|nr:hypothetical protein [Geitlerinema splendidum]